MLPLSKSRLPGRRIWISAGPAQGSAELRRLLCFMRFARTTGELSFKGMISQKQMASWPAHRPIKAKTKIGDTVHPREIISPIAKRITDRLMHSNESTEIATVAATARRLVEQIDRVIVGKDAVVELLLVALFCDGHVLLEDVPGIGKTTLAKTLARSLGCTFSRIQFTPDLLPSDITGVNIFNQKAGEFEYPAGRSWPRWCWPTDQSRRAARERCSKPWRNARSPSTAWRGRCLPFLVLATQNPVELEGTFPLPEAQLDHFLLRAAIGYPGPRGRAHDPAPLPHQQTRWQR